MLSRKATRFIFSFPIQLLVLLIKKNHMLLLYWSLLFYMVLGDLKSRFGTPYLFLDPEYMGHVGLRSFFIMGFTTGSFIMVFNMSSYIINGFRFPFIATLSRPFMKYCINNFILPVLFVVVYLSRLIYFQVYYEFKGIGNILVNSFGFLLGLSVIILVTLTYFFRTNQDIIRMFGMEASDENPNNPFAEHLVTEKDGRKFLLRFSIKGRKLWRVDTYLSSFSKVMLVRKTDHYQPEMIEKIFKQNHLNAAVIEIIVFVSFIILGLFKDYTFFQIPAGASVILIFAMFIMISSAFRFWIRTWSTIAFFLLILLINYISRSGFFYPENKAYGMQYDTKADYSIHSLNALTSDALMKHDMEENIALLERWKSKFHDKPKLILINVSGGGLRASVWAFRVMQMADSLTSNCFIESSHLIAGASGGMIGAAYYRELYLRHRLGLLGKFRDDAHLNNIGKDLLNPIIFSITVSDLFFNFQKFKEGNERHSKDRAYVFEKQLNRNVDNVFDKRLKDYESAESGAIIPMMIFTPTIVNDGRRLLVSPHDISFLSHDPQKPNFNYVPAVDGVEFRRLFKNQHADDLKFSSLIRMSATFPYILPAVSMPSMPTIQIMDAGMRDNTGLKTTLRYLYVFRKWIEENTSGVIVVDVRDSHKIRPVEPAPQKSILENLVTPLGNIYGNLLTIQDYTMDESYYYAKGWFNGKLDFITFELPTREQEISLSWHLTTREKNSIYHTVDLDSNKVAFKQLTDALKENRLMNP
ncbi:MAG: patatin-like phospholipase family protein, partial [Bacteroidota bacterium]